MSRRRRDRRANHRQRLRKRHVGEAGSSAGAVRKIEGPACEPRAAGPALPSSLPELRGAGDALVGVGVLPEL